MSINFGTEIDDKRSVERSTILRSENGIDSADGWLGGSGQLFIFMRLNVS